MELIPIKTRVFNPPQDTVVEELLSVMPALVSGDILLVSSKVVAIDEGRCVAIGSQNKGELAMAAADLIIPRPYWVSPLTVIHHTFVGASGIDESNGDGHLILLPVDPEASAKRIHRLLADQYGFADFGVVVTDSHSVPFRYGAIGVALGWWGFSPLQDHRGRLDLFGRKIEVERSNLVDGLAAAATVVAGEVDECIPAVIARGVPRVSFTATTDRSELFAPFLEDTFRVLYEKWLP